MLHFKQGGGDSEGTGGEKAGGQRHIAFREFAPAGL